MRLHRHRWSQMWQRNIIDQSDGQYLHKTEVGLQCTRCAARKAKWIDGWWDQ